MSNLSIANSIRAETDSVEFSSLATNMKQGDQFRAETINYIRASLAGNNALATKSSSDPIITKFKAVGDAVASSFTESKLTKDQCG